MGQVKILEALFAHPQSLLLCALFGEPERWWSLSELACRTGATPADLRQNLTHLTDCGVVRVKEEDGGGVRFRPDPSCPVHAELISLVTKLTRHSAGGETILVVEDQPATAKITRILLESWGYKVLETHGAAEAIEAFERCDCEIKLVLTDVLMPGMAGPDLARELLRRRPGLPVVFMSGYPNREFGEDIPFLAKPFNPASLSRVIRVELDRARRNKA